jgi:hypothetical protein
MLHPTVCHATPGKPKPIASALQYVTVRFIALGFAQPLIEMSTRNIKIIMFLGIKVRRVRKFDNLTAICAPIVWTMWDP